MGTVAAARQATPGDVLAAILKKFAARHIDHPILDPASGQVASGPEFRYYKNGYQQIADWWDKPFGSCPPLRKMIQDNTGHCGDWGEFLAALLAYQGISASVVELDHAAGFYFGPDPEHGVRPKGIANMLIGPSLWHFTKKNETGNYPYADSLKVFAGKVFVGHEAFSYRAGKTPISQGAVRTPPQMFQTGDHTIVRTGFGWIDPSYGQPQDLKPYPSIEHEYEKSAIVGFAVIYVKDASGWKPLPVTYSPPATAPPTSASSEPSPTPNPARRDRLDRVPRGLAR